MQTKSVALDFQTLPSSAKALAIPRSIVAVWRTHLQAAVLADITAGLFGSRSHTFDVADMVYVITYRLFLSPWVLYKVAVSPCGRDMDDLFEIPTLYEVLCNSAQISMTFTPEPVFVVAPVKMAPLIERVEVEEEGEEEEDGIAAPPSPTASTCSSASDYSSASSILDWASQVSTQTDSDVEELVEYERDQEEAQASTECVKPAFRSKLLYGEGDSDSDSDSDSEEDDDSETIKGDIPELRAATAERSQPAPVFRSKLLYGSGSDSDGDSDSDSEGDDEDSDEEEELLPVNLDYSESAWDNLQCADDDSDDEDKDESDPVSLGYDDDAWSNLRPPALEEDSDADSDEESVPSSCSSKSDNSQSEAAPLEPSLFENPTPWAKVKPVKVPVSRKFTQEQMLDENKWEQFGENPLSRKEEVALCRFVINQRW